MIRRYYLKLNFYCCGSIPPLSIVLWSLMFCTFSVEAVLQGRPTVRPRSGGRRQTTNLH